MSVRAANTFPFVPDATCLRSFPLSQQNAAFNGHSTRQVWRKKIGTPRIGIVRHIGMPEPEIKRNHPPLRHLFSFLGITIIRKSAAFRQNWIVSHTTSPQQQTQPCRTCCNLYLLVHNHILLIRFVPQLLSVIILLKSDFCFTYCSVPLITNTRRQQ